MESTPPLPVTTVVISHNRRSQLLRTLPRHSPPTILVDNGSTDGTAQTVSEKFPDVTIIRLDSNHGAQARNFGVAAATTRYVGFADDDSWWAPGALVKASEMLDSHSRVALLAGRILLGDEQREDPMCRMLAGSPLPGDGSLPGKRILGFASCGAVVRRTAFLQAGGFDPVVFFMGEETRLALDLAAAGWELCYVPELVAHHHPSQTRDRPARRRLVVRNELLTAVMRRPWPAARRSFWRALRSGSDSRRAALTALPRLPAALAARRRVPPHVEARMRLLEVAGS
jgi:GT2 family glycosyltransferase